jgi:hypothetical protein
MNDQPISPQQAYADLWSRARRHEPFGRPQDFGFATRLRSAMRTAEAPAMEDLLARFAWKFSLAAWPVVAGLAILLLLNQGTSLLPEGVGGLVAHWTSYLPGSI